VTVRKLGFPLLKFFQVTAWNWSTSPPSLCTRVGWRQVAATRPLPKCRVLAARPVALLTRPTLSSVTIEEMMASMCRFEDFFTRNFFLTKCSNHTCKSVWLPPPNALQVIRSWSSLPPPESRKSYAVNFDPPPPTDQSHTQCVRPPTNIWPFSWKVSILLGTKIHNYGIHFAKNRRFAPIFASINIKSHYLQDLN